MSLASRTPCDQAVAVGTAVLAAAHLVAAGWMLLAPGSFVHEIGTTGEPRGHDLQAIAALHGAKVTHMKPHGMMANMSADSPEISEAIARATKAVDRDLIFLCQANTEQGKAARKYGLRAAEEVFADR